MSHAPIPTVLSTDDSQRMDFATGLSHISIFSICMYRLDKRRRSICALYCFVMVSAWLKEEPAFRYKPLCLAPHITERPCITLSSEERNVEELCDKWIVLMSWTCLRKSLLLYLDVIVTVWLVVFCYWSHNMVRHVDNNCFQIADQE